MMSGAETGAADSIYGELELFAEARRWKALVADAVREHVRGCVLEVGAGIAGTTGSMPFDHVTRWVCLEPDVDRFELVRDRLAGSELPDVCEAVYGTTHDLAGRTFDTVLYLDVLEHIEDDAAELARAAALLASGGSLIVLAPAHQCLYTPFDRAVGHFRRYGKRSLARAAPDTLEPLSLDYLDSAGLLATLANRLLLRSSMPTPRQIHVWDRLLVPVSRITDPLLRHAIGKSLLAIWRKP